MAVTPLHQNASSVQQVIKTIDKMKVAFTKPAYLHRVVAVWGRVFHNNALLRSNGDLFLLRFYDGSETYIIHCN